MAIGDVWGNSWLSSWGTSWRQAVTPTPPTPAGGGGGGGRVGYRPRFQIIYPHGKRRGKTIDQKIGDWIEAIVAGDPQPAEPAEVAQVRKAVAPYVRENTIDLAAMQRDARQLRALLTAYERDARRLADEREDEDFLLMML